MKPWLLGLVAGATVLATLAGLSTSASFSDSPNTAANAFGTAQLLAPTLAVPVVTGTGATATVALSWDDPDIQDQWQVLRLSGACGTPASLVTTIALTSYTDTPGAAGTYCYAVRGKLQNWLSPLSNLRQVTVPAPPVYVSALRLHATSTMSTSVDSPGNINTNHAQTDTFTSTTPVVSASGASSWTLTLVQRDRPRNGQTGPATVRVWSEDASCSTFAAVAAARQFADGTITVPTAVNYFGVSFSVAGTGAATYTFDADDVLCLSIQDTGTVGDQDIHYHGDRDSTSGVSGASRLEGPFSATP